MKGLGLTSLAEVAEEAVFHDLGVMDVAAGDVDVSVEMTHFGDYWDEKIRDNDEKYD